MALLTSSARGFFRRAVWRWVAVWLALLAAPRAAPAAEANAPISALNQLQAVFLFNFAQFVEWPRQAFAKADAPIVIGVLGEDPFGAYLDGLIQGEKIGDRPLVIRRSARLEDLLACHMIFISKSEAWHYDKLVAQLKGRPVLTVGDADGFNREGGMVRFATENGKVQLRVDVVAVKAANLTISSKLLAHATIVPPGKD